MEIPWFPAITQEEIQKLATLPAQFAWMACHFNPEGNGIMDLPETLPPGCILILNDQIPYHGQSGEVIGQQLTECAQRWSLHGVLLDFERPVSEELRETVRMLVSTLPCPVACGKNLEIEGLVSVIQMPPLSEKPKEYFESKKGVWLELRKQAEGYRIERDGSKSYSTEEPQGEKLKRLQDTALCVHYHFTVNTENADFVLWRDHKDREKIIEQAKEAGIDTVIGLYQEFRE